MNEPENFFGGFKLAKDVALATSKDHVRYLHFYGTVNQQNYSILCFDDDRSPFTEIIELELKAGDILNIRAKVSRKYEHFLTEEEAAKIGKKYQDCIYDKYFFKISDVQLLAKKKH